MSYTFHPSYNYANVTLSAGTGITYNDGTWSTSAVLTPPGGKLTLSGQDADVVINGQSLTETLQTIKDQLLIPTVVQRDMRLEREFAELNELGKQYQRKLEYYREQMKVFETLKKQDL